MKKQRTARLLQPMQRPKEERPAKSKAETTSWEGVDSELFDALRELRRKLAEERKVPPYVIFSDATLRELARVRPSSLEKLRLVYGIGDAKLRDFGPQFFRVILEHGRQRGLTTDNPSRPVQSLEEPRKSSSRINPQRRLAFGLFRDGASIEDVIHQTGRSRSTIMDYLAEDRKSVV